MSNYKNFKEERLREYCENLGVDSSGPRSTLLMRIHQHLKLNNVQQKTTVTKKRSKKHKGKSKTISQNITDSFKSESENDQNDNPSVQIEVVPETMNLEANSNFSGFSQVFENFYSRSQKNTYIDEVEAEDNVIHETKKDDGGRSSDEESYEERVASKKKLRKLNRVSVAVLKQAVKRPDIVEWVDVTAPDPFLLVALKSLRNTVPVPAHWSHKRRFLQAKRGAEKIPYELPDYIQDTGIMQLREATATGNRNKYQAKMGRLDIDYQKLHDAFFKYQTRPHFTTHGTN